MAQIEYNNLSILSRLLEYFTVFAQPFNYNYLCCLSYRRQKNSKQRSASIPQTDDELAMRKVPKDPFSREAQGMYLCHCYYVCYLMCAIISK